MNDSNKNINSLWKFLVSLNGSRCEQNNEADITQTPRPTDMDAFFYIVVVLVFYASSIVLLLIKYSRKDDEEKFLSYQFSEFVKRDKFQSCTYQNRQALLRTKEILATLKKSQNVPSIRVQNFENLEERQKKLASLKPSIEIKCQSQNDNEKVSIANDHDTIHDDKAFDEHCNGDSGINDELESDIVVIENDLEREETRSLPSNKGYTKVTFAVKEAKRNSER